MQNSFTERDHFTAEIKQNKRDLFSFVSKGKKYISSTLVSRIENTQNDKGIERFEQIWLLADTGAELRLKFRIFSNFPYVEYESFIQNNSGKPTDIIEDLNMLELNGECKKNYYGDMIIKDWNVSDAGNRLKISYYLGTYCTAHDFFRIDHCLYPQPGETSLHLGGDHHARSSERALPFFRVDFDDLNGLDFGVGWSGSWKADFELKTAVAPQEVFQYGKAWSISSGMNRTHFYLEPGEELRAPGYFIGFRSGITVRDFINIHRRFMLTHHAPRNSRGERFIPPISLCSWGGVETENMKKVLKTVPEKNLPFDVHWIDAGWQGEDAPCPHFCDDSTNVVSNWWDRVGADHINAYAHPEGLKEIAEFGKECGLETMLWFEPERFHKNCGNPILQEHPEWFLDDGGPSYILDLGNPDACRWISDYIINFMTREKITHYRQDQNMNLSQAWSQADAPDRIGVHEMKHIDGLYRFWRAVRKAHPDGFIDNCASGGRRMDYMLADFSFPLCQSDYETFQKYNYSCVHLENFYLNEVYPLHATLSWMPDGDSYAMFSGGCGTGISSKRWQFPARYPAEDFNYDLYRDHLTAIREMRKILLNGNYYQLTGHPEDLSEFCAMQAHDSSAKEGFVLIFRRPETAADEFLALLPEIDPEKQYELREFGKAQAVTVNGSDFRRFYRQMPEKRSVLLIFYREL